MDSPRLFFKEGFGEKENAADRIKNGLITSQSGQRKHSQKLRQWHTTGNCGLNWCISPNGGAPTTLKNKVMGHEEEDARDVQPLLLKGQTQSSRLDRGPRLRFT